MKATAIALLITALAGSTASAQSLSGWYVSGALGASFRETSTTRTASPRDPFGNSISFDGTPVSFDYATRQAYDTGFNLDLAVGRSVAKAPFGVLRAEAEFEYRRFALGQASTQRAPNVVEPYAYTATSQVDSGLDSNRYAGTANLFYDLTALGPIHPYVGAGVGYQRGTIDAGARVRTIVTQVSGAPETLTDHVSSPASSDDDGTFLAEAGVSIPLSRRLSFAPAYRYTDTFGGGHATHIVKVGLRYTF